MPCPTAASLPPNHWIAGLEARPARPPRLRDCTWVRSMDSSVFSPLMKSDRILFFYMEAILPPAEWWGWGMWGGRGGVLCW